MTIAIVQRRFGWFKLRFIDLDPTESTVSWALSRGTPLSGVAVIDATSFEDLLIEGPWVIRWATWELRCWRIALRPSHVNAAPTSLQRHSRDGATSLARSVSDGAGPSSVTPHDRVNLRGEAGVTITKDRVNPQGARAARLDLQATPRSL